MTSPTTDRRLGLTGGEAIKAPCVAATTAAITLSGAQTIDGVSCVTGDRVLVKNQASGVDNGIYTVDTGTWSRAYDCDGSYDLVTGSLIKVNGGTAGSGFWYLTTTGAITVGTTSLTFANASTVLAVVSAFMQTMLSAADATTAFGLMAAAGISFTGDISPTALSANTDNWAPTGFATASTIRMSSSAAWNLTGIAGGADGRLICLHNISAFVITLKDDATSTAANRFQLGTDYALAADCSVVLQYDATSTRWRIFGQQSAAVTNGIVNALVNGGHEVWQKGTSISVAASNNVYGADQWVLSTNANQACTISRIAGLSSGSQYAATVARNAAQTGVGTLVYEQPFPLEEIVKWRGQTISVSAILSTGANWSPSGGTLAMTLYCGTGAAAKRGNSAYTGESTPLTTNLTIPSGTAAATYSATASAIVPTSTTQMTLAFVWVPTGTAGAADNFSIDDVMMSAVAGAAFERRPYAQELVLCQYFLPVVQAVNSFQFGGQAVATTLADVQIPFKVTPRIAPTGATFSSVIGALITNSGAAGQTTSGIVLNSAGTDGASVRATVGVSLTAGDAVQMSLPTCQIIFTGAQL